MSKQKFLLFCLFKCVLLESFDDTIVITTLSPQYVDVPGEIGIYYNHPNFTEGDTLVLINEKPNHQITLICFWHKLVKSSGFIKTNVQTAPHIGLLYLYSAAITRGDVMLKKSLITNRQHWMSERKSMLENLTIPYVFIPGTHQSGAYYRKGPDDHVFDAKTIASKWTLCQDEAILDQLDAGIRYLDIRPSAGIINAKVDYAVSHAGVEMMPMAEVVDQVNLFMNITEEIVIISFKEFPKGFNTKNDHKEFMKYLKTSFGAHMYPYNATHDWDVPLRDFWSKNKRLIITYDYLGRTSDLWPGIPQFWCNCQNTDTLHEHIRIRYSAAARTSITEPHAAMTEFSHDVNSAVTNFFQSTNQLRAWADMLGPFILKWFNEEWQSVANIVAVDFYQTSGIVETAIYWNERLAKSKLYKLLDANF